VLDRHEAGELPMRNVAGMLRCRDMARTEQLAIDGWLEDERLSASERDILYFYKFHLARIESTTMNAIGYVGTDREGDDATGGWWGEQSGKAIMELIGVGPQLFKLPSDSDLYARYRAQQAERTPTHPRIVEGDIADFTRGSE